MKKKPQNSNRWKTWKTEKIRNQGYKPMSEKENLEKSWKIPYKNCRKWYKKCNTLIKKSPCFGWWEVIPLDPAEIKKGKTASLSQPAIVRTFEQVCCNNRNLASTYRQRQCHGSTKVWATLKVKPITILYRSCFFFLEVLERARYILKRFFNFLEF